MSITAGFIGAVDQPGAASMPTIAVGISVPVGAAIVVSMAATNGAHVALNSVSDSQGNTYVKQSEDDAGVHKAAVFTCDAVTAALSILDTISPSASWDNEGQGTTLHCVVAAMRFA